jgi:hypothetical protein
VSAAGQAAADEWLARRLAGLRRPAPPPTIGAAELAFLARHTDYQIDVSGERTQELLDQISEANLALVCGLELTDQVTVGDLGSLHVALVELLLLAHRRLEAQCDAGPDAEAQ